MDQNFDFNGIQSADRVDIEELSTRIEAFNAGQEDEERFKHYRLTRGVYGQRQLGVQMFRTKIPYGKITTQQLKAIANISDQYATGNLHLTTRQNIQMHYVKLDDSPAVWHALAKNQLTAREACGNTVRNVTASAKAGIDPDEPFDVVPYVQATFEYFLRNPICQEMGRKIKIAFSSSSKDSAFTYFHDFGFIPKIKTVKGQESRGFKVVIGGGLGAVSMVAHEVYDFLPQDQIIPFMEACIRVFDQHGEREKRMKARMKFLIKKLGIDGFMALVEAEKKTLPYQSFPIHPGTAVLPSLPDTPTDSTVELQNQENYRTWLKSNTFEQKQPGYYGVFIKVLLGDLHSTVARPLADVVRKYAADDIRITVNQGLLLRFVKPEYLPALYQDLMELGLAETGFNSTADITACPGTDTCALGVTNSTGLAKVLEEVVREDFPHLIHEKNINIKISGCMNACGQHMAAQIGFHGSSIKKKEMVIPAMQVVVGGGISPHGEGFIAEKVIKLPTKRIPDALRLLLDEYHHNALEEQYFNDFVHEKGKRYFYDLLKPLAEIESLTATDFFDWGQDAQYVQEIGVGECAGVALDVVGTILDDAHRHVKDANTSLSNEAYADSIYWSYRAMVVGAKALLLGKDVKCNTHHGIINDFQLHYVDTQNFEVPTGSFPNLVLKMKKEEPSSAFAKQYYDLASSMVKGMIDHREKQIKSNGGVDKTVIRDYYRA